MRQRIIILVLAVFYVSLSFNTVFALSSTDQQRIDSDTEYYDPSQTAQSNQCGQTTTLSGSDSIQQAFNYFVGQGLTDIQAAGIVGNLLLESEGTMNPEIVEGGTTQADPSDLTTSAQGYGIAQWTPGDKIITLAQEYNISTPVNQLITQLEILWDEINSGGAGSIVSALKQLSNVTDTTTYFQDNFEKPASDTASIAERITYANSVLTKYGNSAGGGGPVTPSNGCQSSVDCTSKGTQITGNAEIACDVLQYDPISYCEGSGQVICPGLEAGHLPGATWHADCPVIGPICATDCSGLVSLAIYDVFGNNGDWDTYSMITDKANFEIIPLSKVLPGDFMQPNTGHVVIIESVSGNTLNTFAANNNETGTSQADQVSPGTYPVAPTNVYLRYVGQGSTYGR